MSTELLRRCDFCQESGAEQVEVRMPEGHGIADVCATHRAEKSLVEVLAVARTVPTLDETVRSKISRELDHRIRGLPALSNGSSS
jgi:hypothetical protein